MTKVMVFGTFDIVHKGHIFFLNESKKLADEMVVIIARDVNVEKLKHSPPMFKELVRKADIIKTKIPDRTLLGDIKDPFKIIKKEKPDIISLGYDQKHYATNLKEKLEVLGLDIKIVRIKSHKPEIYKSSLIKKKMK